MKRLFLLVAFLVSCGAPAPTAEICEPNIVEVERVVKVPIEPEEPAVPDGFPAEDEFKDAKTAGLVVSARLVCSKQRGLKCVDKREDQRLTAIVRHWNTRIRFASSNRINLSKTGDGSRIHDRDRPYGWRFYKNSVKAGWLKPESCVWHRAQDNVGHTDAELRWAAQWPFTSTPVKRKVIREWIDKSHDYERFVARGPNDGVPAYMFRYMLDQCFDPAQFDRNDVAAYAHARKTLKLCGEAEASGTPCTYGYLRCSWGNKGARRCAESRAKKQAKQRADSQAADIVKMLSAVPKSTVF